MPVTSKPMKPSGPSNNTPSGPAPGPSNKPQPTPSQQREEQIEAREAAIRRRLHKSNKKAMGNTEAGKKYKTQHIRGKGAGMTSSDYGVGDAGAGIPYQIATATHKKYKNPKKNQLNPAVYQGESRKKNTGKVTNKTPKSNMQSSWQAALKRRLFGDAAIRS